MWPKNFNFFHSFMKDLSIFFIFNTIKGKPDGLTYYDLTQYGNIPHSKIYRIMKKLEKSGDLLHQDASQETGRPKHLYFLSEQGGIKLKELQTKLGEYFEFFKSRLPDISPDFDHKKFLKEATFKVWASPIEHLMGQDISDEEKYEKLLNLESYIIQFLKKVKNVKRKLEKKLQIKSNKQEEEKIIL